MKNYQTIDEIMARVPMEWGAWNREQIEEWLGEEYSLYSLIEQYKTSNKEHDYKSSFIEWLIFHPAWLNDYLRRQIRNLIFLHYLAPKWHSLQHKEYYKNKYSEIMLTDRYLPKLIFDIEYGDYNSEEAKLAINAIVDNTIFDDTSYVLRSIFANDLYRKLKFAKATVNEYPYKEHEEFREKLKKTIQEFEHSLPRILS